MTAIGYGITGPNLNDEGIRRARPNVPITCIPGDTQLDCALAEYEMTAAEMGAGNGLCEGDSGSGAFEPTSLASAHPIVMGVLSRAADVGSQCKDAVYGRTDTASALLIAAGKEAATTGGYPAPSWTDPGASPVEDAGVVIDAGSSSGEPEIDSGVVAAEPSSDDATTTRAVCAIAAPRRNGHTPSSSSAGVGAVLLLGLALLARRQRRST